MAREEMETRRAIPDFSHAASTGQTLSLGSYLRKVPLVLVFLPGLEDEVDRNFIEEFNRRLAEFGAERSQVLAVVKETARSVREAADELGIALPILSDASGSMIRDYEADDSEGRARRVVVVADKEGELVRRFDPAPLSGQVDDALTAIRGLKTGSLTVADEPDESRDAG